MIFQILTDPVEVVAVVVMVPEVVGVEDCGVYSESFVALAYVARARTFYQLLILILNTLLLTIFRLNILKRTLRIGTGN